ncbi:MAG: lytic transglycosylase domain-containing protein [Acidobacteriota bacterium]
MKALVLVIAASASAMDLTSAAREAAFRHGLDPALVAAVIRVESGWNPDAVSTKGARGLMQLMPRTAKDLGVQNPFDPEENLAGGCRYLRLMLERFSDIRLALAAYNAGPEAVSRAEEVPNYAETRAYVESVLRAMRESAMPQAARLALPSRVPDSAVVSLVPTRSTMVVLVGGKR